MILSIYKVIEEDVGTFYDLELNNFICSLDIEQSLSRAITSIEESSDTTSLLLEDLIPLPAFYTNSLGSYDIIFITSFEFLDANDLKARLRSVIESNHPELLI